MKTFPTYDTYEVSYHTPAGTIETAHLIAKSSYDAVKEIQLASKGNSPFKVLPCSEVDYVK